MPSDLDGGQEESVRQGNSAGEETSNDPVGTDPKEASGNGGAGTDADEADADEADEDQAQQDELRARVEVLAEENRRLRAEYTRARQSQYRRTGLALGVIGLLTVVLGLLFAGSRTVLFALGGTGVFLGVLVYYLTPERFVPASAGEAVYDTLAANADAVTTALGLSDRRLYVPTAGDAAVRLYVPQAPTDPVPEPADLEDTFVVTRDARGLALQPTGLALLDEVEEALDGDLSSDPPTLGDQLLDALVEHIELADSGDVDVATDVGPGDAPAEAAGEPGSPESGTEASPEGDGAPEPASDADEAGRLTIGVSGSLYGDVDRFDHPVASLIAVGTARGLGTVVTLEVTAAGEDRPVDFLVTCRWSTDGEP